MFAALAATGLLPARAAGAEAEAPVPGRAGRIERLPPVDSPDSPPREVLVWLPPGYADDTARQYPVLYLNDGQNVFDTRFAPVEWQFDETALRLTTAGAIAPALIVAVGAGTTRIDDYTAVSIQRRGQTMGGASAAYSRYLVDALKPAIDRRYRTRRGADDTAIGGSSLGGLHAMQMLVQRPDVFGAGLVVSPAVWWGDDWIVQQVARAGSGAHPRVWLDIGLAEGEEAVTGARRLRDTLRARGWPTDYLEAPGARHDEAAWAARVEPMLRFLWPPQR